MIVLGVDIGGTSSRVALFVGGQERGRSEGRGEPMRIGRGTAIATGIAAMARPLLVREGVARADVLVIGASGVGRAAEREELAAAADAERLSWKVKVVTDGELARAAAFGGAPGVLLIAGTGSIAVSVDREGTARRAGGLGWRMGDQGSGYWIAMRALEAVGAMQDGLGPVTHLAERLAGAAGCRSVAELVRWSTVATTADVAGLGPVVVEAADHGDAIAEMIISQAVDWLVRIAAAAGAGPVPVALSGGLIARGRPLRPRLARALGGEAIAVVDEAVDPCAGAVALAAQG